MIGSKLRRLGYAWLVIQGFATVLLPKRTLLTNLRLWRVVENPGALELKSWYVTKLRAMGVGMIAAGLTGLLLERRDSQTATDEDSDGADDDSGVSVRKLS